MTISWTDAAIEAALESYYGANWRGRFQETNNERKNEMRAALDAALAAQGMTAGWINRAVDDAYQEGRADALDEAAKVVEAMPVFCGDINMARTEHATILDAADVVRALKEKKG